MPARGGQAGREQMHSDPTSKRQARSRGVASFLRLLHDKKIIECRQKNGNYEFTTKTKMQALVFFATRFFGLGLSYDYVNYVYGPHSFDLIADYFAIKDIRDYEAITESVWPRMGEFLEFAKDRDHEWLETASTIVFTRLETGLDGNELVEYAHQRIMYGRTQEVYDELEQRGLLNIGE